MDYKREPVVDRNITSKQLTLRLLQTFVVIPIYYVLLWTILVKIDANIWMWILYFGYIFAGIATNMIASRR